MNRGILRPIGLIGIGLIALCFTLLTESPTSAVVLFQSPLPGEPSAYNFEVDADNDGIPDELAAALVELESLAANAQSDAAAEAHYRSALRRFTTRLPYNANVRATQNKLWALHQRLLKAKDSAQAAAIMDEMRTLRSQLLADPNVAITERALRQRFAASAHTEEVPGDSDTRMVEAIDSPDAIWRLFLPITSSSLTSVEPTEPCAPFNVTANGAAKFGQLARGDMLLLSLNQSLNNYFYAMKFSHIGMYNGVSVDGISRVYESNPENQAAGIPDGANLLPLALWQGQGHCVSLMRENLSSVSQSDVVTSLNWAQTRYGVNGETSYNFNFSQKENDSGNGTSGFSLYCSQLIWQIFNHIQRNGSGINVDSNSATYTNWLVGQYPPQLADTVRDFAAATVAPDEVARSTVLNRFSEGTNP